MDQISPHGWLLKARSYFHFLWCSILGLIDKNGWGMWAVSNPMLKTYSSKLSWNICSVTWRTLMSTSSFLKVSHFYQFKLTGRKILNLSTISVGTGFIRISSVSSYNGGRSLATMRVLPFPVNPELSYITMSLSSSGQWGKGSRELLMEDTWRCLKTIIFTTLSSLDILPNKKSTILSHKK